MDAVDNGRSPRVQTDDAAEFYAALGFKPQPEFMSRVSGRWVDNDGNR